MEIERRKRINELLQEEMIQEFMKLSEIKIEARNTDDIRGILSTILKNFTITQTNGIYVCTGAFLSDYDICYGETRHYSRAVDFDNKWISYKVYADIEDGKMQRAYCRGILKDCKQLAVDFEKNNIVLNPYNLQNNRNGYDKVREEFFMTAIEKGQNQAKKLILSKYPRMY